MNGNYIKFMDDIDSRVKSLVKEIDYKYGLDGEQTQEEMEGKLKNLILSNLSEYMVNSNKTNWRN